MNSKKLISLLSASAMTVSAFSGLALTANAADSVLYSDNFNGYTTSSKEPTGSAFAGYPGGSYVGLQNDDNWKWFFNTPASQTIDKLSVGFQGASGMAESTDDDTSVITIKEKTDDSTDKYMSVPLNRFPGRSKATIAGFNNYTANEGEQLLVDFDLMLDNGVLNGSDTVVPASVTFKDIGDISTSTEGVTDGTWMDVKVIVENGTTSVYLNGSETPALTASAVLTEIQPTYFASETKCSEYPSVNIDNLVIMSATDGLTATVPDAETVTPEVSEAPATEAPALAPSITAPGDATVALNNDFNSEDVKTVISMGTEKQDPSTAVEGLSIAVGMRAGSGDATSYAAINPITEGENALILSSGRFSNGGKGPIATLTNNLALTADTTTTSVMAFNFKLSSVGTVPGRMYLLDNTTNVDGNGIARDVMAVFTTEDDASGYANGDTTIGVSVDADTWYTAVVTVSPDASATVYGSDKVAATYRVYVFDSTGANVTGSAKDPIIKGEKVNAGNTSVSVNNLPAIATAQDKDSMGSGNVSMATLDNLITYTTSSTEFEQGKALPTIGGVVTPPSQEPTPEPIAKVAMTVDEEAQSVSLTSDIDTSAVLVQASYRTDKTLAGVKVVNVDLTADTAKTLTAPTELNAFTKNDKFIIVNSFDSLNPLAEAAVVVTGADQATPVPTAAPTEETTVAPTEETTTAPTEEATEEATTTPDTSDVVAVADRAVPADVTQVYEVKTTEALGESSVLKPVTGGRESFQDKMPTLTSDNTLTVDFDVYVADGESISLGSQHAKDLGTMFKFTAADGAMTLGYIANSSGEVNVTSDLKSNTWYNVKITYASKDNTDATAVLVDTVKVEVRTVDVATGTVGDEVIASAEGIGARNSEKNYYNCINFNEVTGAPMVNNFYVYTDAAAATE